MNMPKSQLSMREANRAEMRDDLMTKADIEQFKTDLLREMYEQDWIRAEMRDDLMTKTDSEKLKADQKVNIVQLKVDLLKAMNEQTWKLIAIMVVFNSLLVAVMMKLR